MTEMKRVTKVQLDQKDKRLHRRKVRAENRAPKAGGPSAMLSNDVRTTSGSPAGEGKSKTVERPMRGRDEGKGPEPTVPQFQHRVGLASRNETRGNCGKLGKGKSTAASLPLPTLRP